jgi:charged multivesicular body protein 6
MDDTAESIAKQKEIDELLSGQLTQEDEDEVLKELEHLEELEELNKLVTEEENVV